MLKEKSILDRQLVDCLHFYNQYQLLKNLTLNPLPFFIGANKESRKERSRSQTPIKGQIQGVKDLTQTNAKHKVQKSRKIQTVNLKNKNKRKYVNHQSKKSHTNNLSRQQQCDQFGREQEQQVRQFDDQLQASRINIGHQRQKPGLANLIEQLAFGPRHHNQKETYHLQNTAKFSFDNQQSRYNGRDIMYGNQQYDYNNEPTPRYVSGFNPTLNNNSNLGTNYNVSNLQNNLIAMIQKHQNNKYVQDTSFKDSRVGIPNYNTNNINQRIQHQHQNSSQATFNNQNFSLRQTQLTYTPNNYNNVSFQRHYDNQYLNGYFRPNLNQSYEFQSPRKDMNYFPASRKQRSKSPLGNSYSCNDLMTQSRSPNSNKNRQNRLQIQRPFYQPKVSPLKNKQSSKQEATRTKTTTKIIGSRLANQLCQEIERQFKSDAKRQLSKQQSRVFQKNRIEREQQIKHLQQLRSESNEEDSEEEQDRNSQDEKGQFYNITEYQNKRQIFKTEPRSSTTQQVSSNIFSRGSANKADLDSINTGKKIQKLPKETNARAQDDKELKKNNITTYTPSSTGRAFQTENKNKIEIQCLQQDECAFEKAQNFNRKKLQGHFNRNTESISQVSQSRTIPRPVAVDIYAISKNPKGKR